jgi:lambda family phage tail tape measure protein
MRAAGFAAVEIERFKARRIAEINEKAAQAAETAARKAEAAKEKALKDAQERNALKPYQITALEQMNAGDMFFGKAAADKRGLDLLNDVYERNDELLTEFADKHREVVQGETAFKLEQINLQAQAYRRAGADEVAVEQWAKAEKKKIATDWQTGVLRGLEEVAIGNQDAAQVMEDAITGAFGNMTDAIVDFAMTGKASFSDFAESVIRDMMRMMVQQSITGPLAGAAGDFLSGLFSGSSTASVAPSGASGLYYSVGHAKGGWYEDSPSLSAYSNGIYDKPRYFAFAQGGVFGEAGPEAIMPLKRDAFGNLGVRATGGPTKLVVNIIEAQGKGGQSEQRQEDGVSVIDLFFDQIDTRMAQNINQGRGATTAAMTKTFGLNRSRGALR